MTLDRVERPMSKELFLQNLQHKWMLKDKIGTESSGHWPRKAGACLIQVHLHVKSVGGHKRACLRQVLA